MFRDSEAVAEAPFSCSMSANQGIGPAFKTGSFSWAGRRAGCRQRTHNPPPKGHRRFESDPAHHQCKKGFETSKPFFVLRLEIGNGVRRYSASTARLIRIRISGVWIPAGFCGYAGAGFLVGGQAHRLIRNVPLVCLNTTLNSVPACGTWFAQCRRQDRTHNENYHATRPHRYRIRSASTFVGFIRGRRRGSHAAQANLRAGTCDILLCVAIRTGGVPERIGRRGAGLPARSPLNDCADRCRRSTKSIRPPLAPPGRDTP